MNCDSDNPFLRRESGICSHCISAVSAAKYKILFRHFQTFFVTLSTYGIVQERSFQGARLITILKFFPGSIFALNSYTEYQKFML